MIIVMLRIAGDFALGSPLRGSLPALPPLVNNIIIQNHLRDVNSSSHPLTALPLGTFQFFCPGLWPAVFAVARFYYQIIVILIHRHHHYYYYIFNPRVYSREDPRSR